MTVVYVDGRNGVTFDDALKSLRPGDEVAVVRLADLAINRRQLRKRIEQVHAKRCSVTETSTGRNTRKKDSLTMALDAMEALTHSGKGHNPEKAREFGARGGRPGYEWTPAQAAMIERHWYDMRHNTNPDAIAAINKELAPAKRRVTVNYVWRMMQGKTGNGASGRVSGPRRKSVAKRKR